MTSHEAITVLRNATSSINTTKQGHDLLDQALAALAALLPKVSEVKDGSK